MCLLVIYCLSASSFTLATPQAQERLSDVNQCDIHIEAIGKNRYPDGFERVDVEAVFDGDTVQLSDGRKIRLIGINTPELGHHQRPIEPLAVLAKERLLQLLMRKGEKGVMQKTEASSAKEIKIPALLNVGVDAKDRYSRVLGHLFTLSGVNLSYQLLKEGWGFHVAIPPNLGWVECYARAEQTALVNGVGVWKEAYFAPKDAMGGVSSGGYKQVVGNVGAVYVSDKNIWIDLEGDVTIKLNRNDKLFHKGVVLKRILDAYDKKLLDELPSLVVRGWLIDRKRWGKKMAQKINAGERNRWQFSLRHRSQWQFSKTQKGLSP